MWPLISVTAHLDGRGPAVIQVGLLSWFVFSVTWFHEAREGADEWDSDSEVAVKKKKRSPSFSRIPQNGPSNGGLHGCLLKHTLRGRMPKKNSEVDLVVSLLHVTSIFQNVEKTVCGGSEEYYLNLREAK